MSHRVNILLSDETWNALQEIPRGERSRFIDKAVVGTLQKQRRLEAIKNIDKIRKRMKPAQGTAEDWIREDRDNHQ